MSERSFQTRSRIATSLTLLKNRSHAYHSHTSKYHRFSTSSISYFWKKNGMHVLKFSGMWAYSACRPTLPFTSINLSSHDNFFLLFQRFCWTFFERLHFSHFCAMLHFNFLAFSGLFSLFIYSFLPCIPSHAHPSNIWLRVAYNETWERHAKASLRLRYKTEHLRIKTHSASFKQRFCSLRRC